MGGTNFKLDIGVTPDLKKIMQGGSGTGGLSSSTSAIVAKVQQALKTNLAIDMALGSGVRGMHTGAMTPMSRSTIPMIPGLMSRASDIRNLQWVQQRMGQTMPSGTGIVTGMPITGKMIKGDVNLHAASDARNMRKVANFRDLMDQRRAERDWTAREKWGDLGNVLNPQQGIQPNEERSLGRLDLIPKMEREILPQSIKKLTSTLEKISGPLTKYAAIATGAVYGIGKTVASGTSGPDFFVGGKASAAAPSIIAGRRAAEATGKPGQFGLKQQTETAEGGATLIGQTLSQITASGRQVPQHIVEAAMQYGEKTGDYGTAASLMESNPGRLVYLNSKTQAQEGGAVRIAKTEAGVRQRQKDAAETDAGRRGIIAKGVGQEVLTMAMGEKGFWNTVGQMTLNILPDSISETMAAYSGDARRYKESIYENEEAMARIRAKHPPKNTYSPIPPGHLPPPGYDTSTGGNRGMAASSALMTAATIMQSQNAPGGQNTPVRAGQ